jgi:VCBS repeat protein
MTRISLTLLATFLSLAGPATSQAPIYEGTAPGPNPYGLFPFHPRVVAIGDTDGDGRGDFAMQKNGALWQLRSGANGSLRFDITATAPIGGGLLGDLQGAGDSNGDGAADIAHVNGAVLFMTSGSNGSTLWTAALPNFIGPFFPHSPIPDLCRIGDVNGDGIGDLAIGFAFTTLTINPFLAPGAPIPPVPPTAAYLKDVEIRSGADGSLLTTIPSANPNLTLTRRVASAGDLNGDGLGDLLIQSEASNGINHDIHDGASGGLLASVLVSDLNIPGHIAGGHDIDGDGAPDFVVGIPQLHAQGEIRAYSGATGQLIATVSGEVGDNFGFHPSLGDHDGDGRADALALCLGSLVTGGEVKLASFAAARILNDSSQLSGAVEGGALLDVNADGFDDIVASGFGALNDPTSFGAIAGRLGLGLAANPNTSLPDLDPNLLRVSGEAGGGFRSVSVAVGQALNFEIRTPPINAGMPFDYAIFAYLGAAQLSDTVTVGAGIGDFSFTPAALFPAGVPVLFTLATNLGGLAGTIVPTPPGPQIIGVPAGIPVALDLTVQAVVIEPNQALRKTNGILVSVR